ncbi:S41 family peptidase [Sphingobacterium mizutaii]|uniref:S41 family peptidase n=1 Tax=Sphingobacterium mizutaii TaxID=1010 RepID=UPI0028A0D12B|nr:S41 family peptidase [Sphingobacterium mizutaii]
MKNTILGKLLVVLTIVSIFGCKKDLKDISPPPRPGGNRTIDQQVLDSVYSKYKYLSYWESSIQVVDPISNLTDKYTDSDELLSYLMGQTPQKTNYIYHPRYNGPLDRFSWLEDISSDSKASLKADLADGYGLYMAFDGDRGDSLFVYFVEGGSPGQVAGIKRGDKVLEMQGDKKMVFSNKAKVDQYIEEKNLSIKTENPQRVQKSYNLTYTSYDIQPFQLGKVFTENGKKAGYIGLSSFEELQSGGSDSKMKRGIDSTFTAFASQNVTKLIVDLRYNGGGYVSSSIYLLNKIINTAGNNKVMFKYDLNKNLKKERDQGSHEFVDEIFKKDNGTLEIQQVVFLVSDNTASASEIVISALKPYMDVKLVGYDASTYGKPVGFFREDILNKVGLWAASFKIVNAANYTDYWDGIPADYPNVFDNFYKQLGDPNEDMTRKALNILIGPGSKASSRTAVVRSSVNRTTRELNKIPVRNMVKD